MTRQPVTDRPLPHNLDAERAVLGALLVKPELASIVAELVDVTDFFRDAHRRIFGAAQFLTEHGSVVDFVTLKNLLTARGDLDEVGGPAYLASLCDGLPRSTNVRDYAAIVKEKSRLREAIYAGTRLIQKAFDEDKTATDLLAETGDQLLRLGEAGALGGPVLLNQLANEGMELIERAHQKNSGLMIGAPSGFKDLDEITTGFHPGDLGIVAARPGIGKTSLALNVARRVVQDGASVVFSLEMSRQQCFLRLLSAEARVDGQAMRTGYLQEHEWGRLSAAIARLYDLPLHIDDTPAIGVLEVRARARAIPDLKLIIVDYIQLMRGRGRFDSRQQEIGTLSRGLKAVARELNVPVVALAQLSRAAEGTKPQLSHLRESGDLEADADLVLFLWRPDDDQPNLVEVVVAKQRNGPVGEINLSWIPHCTRFENWTRQTKET